jgi:NAD(P)-dependent dehydrogenase (short-subunit alcohol dehydrogenase family)
VTEGRLAGLVAVVVGAGQTPGDTIGNGRAIATTFAREGAEVLCVDRIADRAEETATSIRDRSGLATAFTAMSPTTSSVRRSSPMRSSSGTVWMCS